MYKQNRKGEDIVVNCGFCLALWARLIEIGVRTTFCTFAMVCAHLYEELGEQMEELVANEKRTHDEELIGDQVGELDSRHEDTIEKSREDHDELQKWKDNYETVNSLIESLSFSFGLVLLLFICQDFGISIFKFSKILRYQDKCERVCAFAHQLFRIFTLLAASNHVHLKV